MKKGEVCDNEKGRSMWQVQWTNQLYLISNQR